MSLLSGTRLAVGFLIHEAPSSSVSLGPAIVGRVVGLGAVSHRSVPSVVAGRRVRSHGLRLCLLEGGDINLSMGL